MLCFYLATHTGEVVKIGDSSIHTSLDSDHYSELFYFFTSMFTCYICSETSVLLSNFRVHIQRHVELFEHVTPFKCCQGACQSSFSTVFNFFRHLRSYHLADDDSNACFQALSNSDNAMHCEDSITVEDSDMDVLADVPLIHSEQVRLSLADIQSEGTSMVAALRANISVPYSIITGIVESVNSMISTTVSVLKSETMEALRNAGVGNNILSEVDNVLTRHCDTLHQPLSYMSTRYKQDQHFDQHPLAVKPETVVLGSRNETRQGVDRLVYDSYQYVSIEATLRTFLKNPEYVNLLLRDVCSRLDY